jgi:7-cyano-7-deazaguanine reductase
MTSDELTAVCPITAQPDFYVARIVYRPDSLCLESKSLKLYLARFRNEGAFGEALAVQIRDDVAAALELGPAAVTVTLTQKGACRHHDHRDGVIGVSLRASSRSRRPT